VNIQKLTVLINMCIGQPNSYVNL